MTSPYGDRDGPRAPGSGAGLVGMEERVALLDGTFEAGPEGAGPVKVWTVRATLPITHRTHRTHRTPGTPDTPGTPGTHGGTE